MARERFIDLHTHTTASDGSLSPAELVRTAGEIGLAAVAITDHDTLTGVPDALAAGKRHGVEVVPGVEISSYGYGRQMDILCYFIEPDCAAMNDLIEWAQRKRSERNPEIARRIAAQGVPLDLSDVEKLAGGGQVGRPHFARALIDVGAVKDVREAFERFLGPGAIAYVPKARVEPERVISVVREAGGVSVLAHPVQLEMETDEELRGLVESLSAAGLGGIEAHYPSHSESQTELYRTLAGEFNLAVTGGSDFHGETKPTIHLGEVRESRLPYALLDDLRSRLPVTREG